MTQPTPEMLKLLEEIREEHWPNFDAAVLAAIQRTTELAANTEILSRLIDPDVWACDGPVPTRADTIEFHKRRGKANDAAHRITNAYRSFDHLKGQSDE